MWVVVVMCEPTPPRFRDQLELTGTVWSILGAFGAVGGITLAWRLLGAADVVAALAGTVAIITVAIVLANGLSRLLWGSDRSRRTAAALRPAPHALPESVQVRAWIEGQQQGAVWSSERPPAIEGDRPALEPSRVWTAQEWSA